jgi:hypothetical protein
MALALVGVAAGARAAQAQRTPETFHACYSPPSGVVYRIREPGVPRKCVDAEDVEFSWTSGGGHGAGGGAGPAEGGGQGGAPTVPTGAVVFFEAESCPSAWTTFEPARGRAVVGLVSGGTPGGLVGSPLADLENREHSHVVEAADVGTSTAGSHTHATPEQTVLTDAGGVHNHVWARKTSGSGSGANLAWYDGRGTQLINWGDGVGNEGSGHYPISTSEWGSLTLYTSMSGSHAHSVTLGPSSTAEGGDHKHDVTIPQRTTTAASTSDVMPYVQLLACRKN